MNYQTAGGRLSRIGEFNLPHFAKKGNHLPKDKAYQICGEPIDADISELIIDINYIPRVLTNFIHQIKISPEKSRALAKSLSKASGEMYSVDELLIDGPENAKINKDLIACHAFYNPRTDLTHYFILPVLK